MRATPPRTTAPPTDADLDAAARVLRTTRLGGPDHPEVRRFEALLAQTTGVAHAVAVNSGTAALHCALRGLGIGPGDEVIVPAHTFIASATPVLMSGATPVVVDVDAATYCLEPTAVDEAITRRTRAVVAVHLNGHPAPVDLLPTDLPVLSDACQAQGATLHGTSVAALGAAGVYSFWQDKLLTTGGEGGAVLTDDPGIAEIARLVRSHGQQPIPGTPDSHHTVLGYNYRLTGPQAAFGHSQLTRFANTVRARQDNAARLLDLLQDIPGITPPYTRDGATHVYWKFVIAIDPDQFRVDLRHVLRALAAEGVPAAPRYPIPLHRQPVLTRHGRTTPCPTADALSQRLLTLPLPAMAEDADDVVDIAEAVRKVATALRR
ncbi:perosamine synthetase [Streptoalloteichus hindustanus]|uniref:Perosamine synthetase n=1 Tax=Streptoalloteichus hindustanus TaxID=2017 RepID=A0A1M5HZU2_STRHI|nr:perosamine synthetase [Streptoalloteichus hindustanus]